jgi:hypothetical protein
MQRAGRAIRHALTLRAGALGFVRGLVRALACALLAACQSPPLSPEQIATLDYGPRPDDYDAIVRDYVKRRVNDPDYSRIEIKAGPARLYQDRTLSRERQYGWAVCVAVNERDQRGVYTEYPMVIYIRGEKVVAENGGGLERAAGLRYAQAQCSRLGFEPP